MHKKVYNAFDYGDFRYILKKLVKNMIEIDDLWLDFIVHDKNWAFHYIFGYTYINYDKLVLEDEWRLKL